MEPKTNYGRFLIVAITAVIFFTVSCSKKGVEPVDEPALAGKQSTRVFYADTFKVYSTDLNGGSRIELVNEDLKSENNYIASYSISPESGKIVYVYSTGYLDPVTIKTANADGSGKKVIKTIAAGMYVFFAKAISGNRIYYGTSVPAGTSAIRKFYVMNDDGTNEKELTGLSSFVDINNEQISAEAKGLITNAGYFVKLKNDTFSELDSYNVLTNENTANIYGRVIMSSDAKKIAFISRTAAADKFEIRVKDISTKNTSSVVAYTYTMPTTGAGAITNTRFNLCWVDGNQRLLLSYGKFTLPKGALSDYLYCVLLDPVKNAVTNWSFTGDGLLMVQAN